MKIPKEHSKILVYNTDPRYVSWKLGQFGIFLEKLTPIQTKKHLHKLHPSVAKVRYDNDQQLLDYIAKSDLGGIRIFKSMRYWAHQTKPALLRERGMVFESGRNLLALLRGKTIRIKSQDIRLRRKFYKIFKMINEEDNFNCKFDFDEYDITFVIKKYPMIHERAYIVTYFYGKDYPNIKEVRRCKY